MNRSVVLNWCAVAPLSALKSTSGAASFWAWRLCTSKIEANGSTKLFYSQGRVRKSKNGRESLAKMDMILHAYEQFLVKFFQSIILNEFELDAFARRWQ